ncbi:tryptophan-rich sensory protein [Rhizomicrobium palustre]|uniref:Tryptophan-rich sensory protein n=1 Tax=Rhizomicrobium palustre TaxID=189966 RepID=A0A846MY03_9PROT|nr:TspO/MBR family protein [Rhizomicrobium palustre]NIK88266.1 tryptophan-rich sensory protein [Rhizomicrobium palustre]
MSTHSVSRPSQGLSILFLSGFLLFTLAIGWTGGAVTAPNIPTWYAGLAKPSFNPPNWLFMPVWTTLYVLMAIAAWRIWRRLGIGNFTMALWLFQLTLNFAWSFIFFGAHQPMAAFFELTVMWVAILLTMIAFLRIDTLAGLLLLPYLAWVSFAGVLNFWIWQLNP